MNRNIALCILLTIITCGIYGIYWFVVLTNDVVQVSSSKVYKTSGGMAFFLTLITCGIYGFYWAYQMGKSIAQAQADKGMATDDKSVLYIVLQVLGLGIVSYCLIQSDLNVLSENNA